MADLRGVVTVEFDGTASMVDDDISYPDARCVARWGNVESLLMR